MQDNVQQSASDVAREARALAQSLKEAVRRNETPDRDVEFKRKSLRRQHLKLLLLYPNSKEAKDAETHIWMQTSYQIISVYKQRLAVLDRKLFSPAARSNKATGRQGPGEGGHVEYRKTLARLRQFLAEEERFYVQLLIRYQSQFGLIEARQALIKTEILSPDGEDVSAAESGRNLFPEQIDTFPQTGDEREARIATFTKLLVCLGDITRYREQYNDSGGRPRAGHEEGPPRKVGRGGKRVTHEPITRPRNYNRAKDIYEQARLLLPNDGNAFHQLAILSSYQKDSFGSLLNYYRALCVRQPYDTASDNLNTVLKKALDQYRASKGNTADDPHAVQKIRVDRFLETVAVLHGLWYFDSDEHASRASKQSRHVVARFKSLVSEPALPSNTISEILLLAFSALWKIRMIRDRKIRANRTIIEPVIATHILYLLRGLLDVSRVQLSVKIEDVQDEEDLAQKITRVFRRVLPAMRIMSKWLRTNLNYLVTAASSVSSPGFLKSAIKTFWEAYTAFLTPLSETFPSSKLPVLKGPLEEDVDLSGFSPIKKSMLVLPAPMENGVVARQEEVHPNEEYLMRISDLLKDAEQIAVTENSPVVFSNGKFASSGRSATTAEPTRSPSPVNMEASFTPLPEPGLAELAGLESDDDDDENAEQTSRTGTEDDVVREAFKEALRDDLRTDTEFDEEEDEKIVWSPPKSRLSPLQKIIQPPHMSPQIFPSAHSPATATASPTRPLPPSIHSSGTTAQDLLNNVLSFSRSKSEHTSFGSQAGAGAGPTSSTTPQASLLFGSGSFISPTKSIWTSTSTSGQSGATGHASPSMPQFGPGSLTPGHERARSQSFSFSQLSPTQSMTNAQDSIYGSMGNVPGALPTGHLGVNYGRLAGHHQSLSLSGAQSAFQNAPMPVHGPVPAQRQVYYDSHLPQMSPAAPFASQLPDTRGLQSYVGQNKNAMPGPEPFLYYDSQGKNAFSSVQSSTSANQAIWGT